MNEKKQKKIRAFLINFVNEELNRKKRNNKNDILINSIPLDILAEKNMQCKVFLVKEHNYFYQQNVDVGWMMGVNFDINNSYHQKPIMDLFADGVRKEIEKIDSSDIGEEKIEIVNQETIIKKNIDRILYIHHGKEMESPLGISLFQKKEISERKFVKENNDYFSGKVSNFFLNKNDKEKGKEEIKKKETTNSFENFMLIKRYSNITLETELSRIIKCCHEEDCPSSQERCISESRRSEMNKELKIARMYAKRLNLYCKNLKKNVDKKYLNGKNIIKKISNHQPKEDKNNKNEDLEPTKMKSHRIQKIKYKKIIPKKHDVDDKLRISKFNCMEKKSRTNKVNNDSDRNNYIIESSSHFKGNNTSRENTSKHKKGLLKINQFKKRNSSTFRNKLASRLKQVYFKSPKKVDTLKRKKSKQINEGGYKKLNMNERILNNILKSKKEEDHTQKIIKTKKKQEHKNDKTSNFRISKFKYVKRSSMVDKMNHTGLEKINFFGSKTKSTFIPLAIKPTKKKSKKKKEKEKEKFNYNNNINNNSTSISQRKDTSDSSEIIFDKKINSKNKIHKKNTAYFMKRKKENLGIENLKKIKKRRTSDYDNVKIHKLKRISPLKTDREKRNHTTDKNKQKFGRQHELNEGEVEVTDFDDFNLIDEFLYKTKLKRRKNCNVVGMN